MASLILSGIDPLEKNAVMPFRKLREKSKIPSSSNKAARAMLKRGGTRNKIGPETVSEEGETLRIDFWTGIRIVDDGAYDGFPVWPEKRAFGAAAAALTGPFAT